jgi:hypothetical protein
VRGPAADPDRVEHEAGLARFVEARRRERFVLSLSNERLRRKLGRRLCHHDDFDRRYVVTLEDHLGPGFAREVYETLTARGAPRTCFVLAPGHALDGMHTDLEEVLDELISYGPALISCIPGRLALYVSEYANPVWLLERRQERLRRPPTARCRGWRTLYADITEKVKNPRPTQRTRPASSHANALPLDLDEVAAVQLAPAPGLDLAVDAHGTLGHELAGLAA